MLHLLSSGSNARGQLAHGTQDDSHSFQPCQFSGYPPGQLPLATRHISNIVCGANHTLVLLERIDGDQKSYTELWGCGDGRAGQLLHLGRDAQTPVTVFQRVELPPPHLSGKNYRVKLIAAAWETSYVVLSAPGEGDVLISMGSNDFGDLGVHSADGSRKGENWHTVDFGHLHPHLNTRSLIISSITAGQHHVLVQINDTSPAGSVIVGWGMCRHGQLGTHPMVQSYRLPPFIRTPTQIDVPSSTDPVISFALGAQHTVLLHASGAVSALGSNRKNQLDGLNGVRNAHVIGCTWNNSYCATTGSTILAAGSHTHGQLGRHSPTASLAPIDLPLSLINYALTRLACGSEHVLAVFTEETTLKTEVWGWGWNEHGNLGTGETEDALLPLKIWPEENNLIRKNSVICDVWGGLGTSWVFCSTDE